MRLRTFFIIAAALISLICLAVAGISWFGAQELGPERWAMELEKQTQCRAHFDSASLSMTSSPAQLIYRGVKLLPRDAEVDKPYAERAPLAADAVAPVQITELRLEMNLLDLKDKRFNVERLEIIEPIVRDELDERGKSRLEALFKKPKKAKAPADKPQPSNAAPANPPKPRPPETLDEDAFAIQITEAALRRGQLTILSKGTTVQIHDLDFILSDIDIDPRDLLQHNRARAQIQAHIEVQGTAKIAGVKQPAQLANLQFNGAGEMIPIDATTREFLPTSKLKLALAKGSVLGGHITMADAAGKNLKKLQKYGIDLSPVRVGGPLIQDAVLEGHFKANRLTLLAHTPFVFPDYEVVIHRGSWFNGPEDRHDMELRLSCGPTLQAQLQQGMAKAKLGGSLASGLIKALSDERGQLTFDIDSSGSLSDPKILPKVDRLLENLLRGEGVGDLLQGLLKKL
jgi:hypothetical protein